MASSNLFFDSSALIAGIISTEEAARALLLLSENKKIDITISEQVLSEVERNIAKKIPKVLPYTRELILEANIRIVRDPTLEQVNQHTDWINHQADVPILVAAVQAQVDFFVPPNTKHFIDDPYVTKKSGLSIGTPGDALI